MIMNRLQRNAETSTTKTKKDQTYKRRTRAPVKKRK